jgi:peptide chain release factor subunit 1
MISRADVDKLLSAHATDPVVLSLYVQVPVDPAALRGLPARAGELLAAAAGTHADGLGAVRARDADVTAVRDLLEEHARGWLGHTAAIFACGPLGLAEAIALPGTVPERAVIATRPHVRPLLMALQRCPGYHVAVVDRRHAWVFKVAGERIDTVAQSAAEGVRPAGFGGWYGLEAHRIHERVIQLARRHYRETAALLGQAMGAAEPQPLVVGGHEDSIPQFLAVLPAGLRDRLAGSFVADPHTLTPARVRELAAPVIEHWVTAREQRLISQIRALPPGGLAAAGPHECAAAVNQHAVQLLIVPDDGLVPGYACGRCGGLALAGGDCPGCGAALGPVPDLIEEMAVTALGDGGQVEAVADPPGGVAARLRFPLAAGAKR